jgi:O-antigen/teichoic acid export membrane protein
MQKQLQFSRRALIDFLTAVSKAVLTIYLALLGWKEWALAAGFVFGAAFRSAALWLAVSWRPELHFAKERARQMLHYGKHIVGNGLIGNIIAYVDQLAILIFFGKEPLAYYFVAARIPELFIYQITVVLTTVLFPTMSNMKSEPATLRHFVVQSTRLLSYVIFPLTLGIVATAEPLLEFALGSTWIPSATFLILLTLGGLLSTYLWVIGDGLKAVGRPDVIWRITLIEMVVSVPATLLLVCVLKTPVAACFGVLSGIVVANVLRLDAARRYLGIPVSAFFEACRPAAVAATMMFGAVALTDFAIGEVPLISRLACEVVVGIVVYVGLLWLIDGERLKADFGRLASDMQPDRLTERAAESPGHGH